MLLDLDSVPWNALTHAYGSANDVPELLRDLGSADEKHCNAAIYELYGNIWHQGTVYEASSYAVPFLIQILGDENNPCRDQILMLLSDLANGTSYHDVHQHLASYRPPDENLQEKIKTELTWVRNTINAVGEGLPVYLKLLDGNNEHLRQCTVALLGRIGSFHPKIPGILRQCLNSETNESTIAGLLIALGNAKGSSEEVVASGGTCLPFVDAKHTPLVRIAAAISLASFQKEQASEKVVAALLEGMTANGELEELFSSIPWNEDLSCTCCSLLPDLGERARSILPALIGIMEKPEHSSGILSLLETTVQFAFAGHSPTNLATRKELNHEQIRLIRAIAGNPGVWLFADSSQVLRKHGLPDTKAAFMTFAG